MGIRAQGSFKREINLNVGDHTSRDERAELQ
jgi:hypothetical protein